MIPLRIAFIGAGQVNFGGGEGPWAHADRLEKLHSTQRVPLNIVAICDPFVQLAEKVLKERQAGNDASIWQATRLYSAFVIMLDAEKPDAVFIGVPPFAHGSVQNGFDIEIQCAKRGIHMFVEKPLSCAPSAELDSVNSVLMQQQQLIVSVGYMFRYSKPVQEMKRLISKLGSPRAFSARYNCAYSFLGKMAWWDARKSGGPLVEQATHFIDLARFLCGEIELSTIHGDAVTSEEKVGGLSAVPVGVKESEIAVESRTPRVSSAMWRFSSGAIGSLMHTVLLHGKKYDTELEVVGDGYRLVLQDPYNIHPRLLVRTVDSEELRELKFDNDDPYLSEDYAFLQAVGNPSTRGAIQSTYGDALGTYRATCVMRDSCLATAKKHREIIQDV